MKRKTLVKKILHDSEKMIVLGNPGYRNVGVMKFLKPHDPLFIQPLINRMGAR